MGKAGWASDGENQKFSLVEMDWGYMQVCMDMDSAPEAGV